MVIQNDVGANKRSICESKCNRSTEADAPESVESPTAKDSNNKIIIIKTISEEALLASFCYTLYFKLCVRLPCVGIKFRIQK